MKFFSLDSKFYRVMMSVGEMMILNFCWVIACLPLITVGAANTAMYTVMGRRLRDEGSGTVVPFFKALWKNLKKSTLFWVAQAFVTVSLSLFFFLPLPLFLKVAAGVLLVLVHWWFQLFIPRLPGFGILPSPICPTR
jgi:hypothetical protein